MLPWIEVLLIVCLCYGQYIDRVQLADGIEYHRDYYSYQGIVCITTNLDDQPVSPKAIHIYEEKLHVIDCSLPKKSYAESLAALNVDVTVIVHLGIIGAIKKGSEMQTFTEMHFKDLPNLRNLSIVNPWWHKDYRLQILSVDFLNPLSNLTEFYTYHMENVTLPEKNSLRKVNIERGTLYNKLGGCQALEDLTVVRVTITEFTKDLISHCSQLTSFSIIGIDLTEDKLRDILSEARQLHNLTVSACQLHSIDQLNLTELVNLKRIDFSANAFITGSMSYWPKLEEITLQYTDLSPESVRSVIHEHKDLISLDLTGSYTLDICNQSKLDKENHRKSIIKHSKLQRLIMKSNRNNDLCFDQLEALEYIYIDLWTTALQFNGLPVSRAPLLVVYLSWYSEELTFQFSEEDYKMLRNESYYFDKINSTKRFTRGAIEFRGFDRYINCDCQHGWFARALHDEPRLKFELKILCQDKNNTLLLQAPAMWMECDRWQCAENCTCRRYWSNNATDIDCYGRRLETIPHVSGLRVLIAPNNEIKTIHPNDFPETLTMLDLSNNRLSLVDGSAATALFSVIERRLRLAGNPIVCNCDNREFIEKLKLYHNQVEDYENVTCAEDGKLVADLDLDKICISTSRLDIITGIVATVVLLAVAALAGTVYYRYERELRVFLYARGWCLWYVREEELDADRPYDAFVSFSHGDEEYVIEELVPALESAPHAYKLCVHYRDWVPGEFIPLQISRSVEQSRRTIIVMSKNYMSSMWGLLEFRTAHEDTLNSRRPRIIVILFEDMADDVNLDGQVRNYLKNNTYLKNKDPWFWKKLLYAMPHRESSPVNTRENNEVTLMPTSKGAAMH